MKIISNKLFIIIITTFAVIGFLVHRFVMMTKSGVPLGWDAGRYRDYFLHYYSRFGDIDIFHPSGYLLSGHPPFLGILGSFLKPIGVSVDQILLYAPFLLYILTAGLIYVFLRSFSPIQARLGTLFFLFSPVFFLLMWSGFLKHLFATFLFVGFLLSFSKRKYIVSTFLSSVIFFTHRPTSLLLFFVVVSSLFFLNKKDRTLTFLMLVWSGVISFFLYLPIIDRIIFPVMLSMSKSGLVFYETGGTFLYRDHFLLLEGAPILLLFCVFVFFFHNRKEQGSYSCKTENGSIIIMSLFFISLAWLVFGGFFHNRMQPFFDLSLIFLTTFLFVTPLFKNHILRILLVSTLLTQAVISFSYSELYSEPQVSPDELQQIKNLDHTLPSGSFIIVHDKFYTTWLMGYNTKIADNIIGTQVRDVTNKWQDSMWRYWWNADGYEKCEFIYDFYQKGYKPLYVFIGELNRYPLNLDGGYCFYPYGDEKMDSNIYVIDFS